MNDSPGAGWAALRRSIRARLAALADECAETPAAAAWRELASMDARLPDALPAARMAAAPGGTSVPAAGFYAGELALRLRARATAELDALADQAAGALDGWSLEEEGWLARGFHLARVQDGDDGPTPGGDGTVRRREMLFTFAAWRKPAVQDS